MTRQGFDQPVFSGQDEPSSAGGLDVRSSLPEHVRDIEVLRRPWMITFPFHATDQADAHDLKPLLPRRHARRALGMPR
jgi:hypothetical protein